MKVILSSDALPEGDIGALMYACGRRALAGLELTVGQGHAHGFEDGEEAIPKEAWQRIVRDHAVPVHWLRFPPGTEGFIRQCRSFLADAGVGVLVHEVVDGLPLEQVCLLHGSDSDRAAEAAAWASEHGAGTCWQVGAERVEAGRMDAILEKTAATLRHVRLLGGGPESDPLDPGSGTGSMLSRLALAGYAGTIAMAPGRPDRLGDWERWLMKTRGWGCGTAAEKQARAQARRLEPLRTS